MSISSVSTELAVLIGLGVGVDYGLFINQPVPERGQATDCPTPMPRPWL